MREAVKPRLAAIDLVLERLKAVEARLGELEGENRQLRSDNSRLRWMVFKQISEVARIEVGDSDAKCNAVDSIGSSTKSRVSHSEHRPSARFGDKDGSARRMSSPFSDARGCTSPQNSGVHLGLDKPRKRPPGAMVKELADTTGWSPSGLRKLAKRRAAAGDPIGQWHGGRLFLDPTKVPPRGADQRTSAYRGNSFPWYGV